jgi:hypothetical protein
MLHAEVALRAGLVAAEAVGWAPVLPMARDHEQGAVCRCEARLRKTLLRQELLHRVQLIQRQSDQADVLTILWPQVLALAQAQTDGRVPIEDEEAAAFAVVKGKVLADALELPFRTGARKALERIQLYCAEHYPS